MWTKIVKWLMPWHTLELDTAIKLLIARQDLDVAMDKYVSAKEKWEYYSQGSNEQ